MNRKWTEEDSRWLRDNHSRMDPLTLAGRLKVPVAEVERRLAEMRSGAESAVKKTPASIKEAAREHALARSQFEKALDLFHRKELEQAAKILKGLVDSVSDDKSLLDRARMYLAACGNGRGAEEKKAVADDLFHQAVFEKNRGNVARALELLKKADKDGTDPRAAYLAACCHALTGETDVALSHLRRAIQLDRQNRVQARIDADLAGLRARPGFAELLSGA